MLIAPGINRLIEALPRALQARMWAQGTPVDLACTEVLASAGERIGNVYFPAGALICECITVNGVGAIDTRLIGVEGMLGVSLVLGVEVAPLCAVVRSDGVALRMSARAFRRQLAASPVLQAMLMRYVQVVVVQLAQFATCTRFHLLDARLARLLLMTQDRVSSARFHLTQEVLAARLGVRRAGVTAGASALQRHGLISYRRGDIRIEDRGGLMQAACACYAADTATYGRVMGPRFTRDQTDE